MDARQHGWRAWRRTATRAVAWTATTATLVFVGSAPTTAATVVPDGALMPVVVEGAADAAADEVTRLGGVVDSRPAVADELRARVPVAGIAVLRRVDGVRAVTPDGTLASLREERGVGTSTQGRWAAGA